MNTVKDVTVRILEGNGNLKGLADVLIEPGILIRACPIMKGKNGSFATMPKKLSREGRWSEVVVIENEELKTTILNAIISAYGQALVTA